MTAQANAMLVAELSGPQWFETVLHEYQALCAHRWKAIPDQQPISKAAQRMARSRARRAAGRLCLKIEISEAVPTILEQAGFLSCLNEDEPRAIASALETMLSRMVAIDIDDAHALRVTTQADEFV